MTVVKHFLPPLLLCGFFSCFIAPSSLPSTVTVIAGKVFTDVAKDAYLKLTYFNIDLGRLVSQLSWHLT